MTVVRNPRSKPTPLDDPLSQRGRRSPNAQAGPSRTPRASTSMDSSQETTGLDMTGHIDDFDEPLPQRSSTRKRSPPFLRPRPLAYRDLDIIEEIGSGSTSRVWVARVKPRTNTQKFDIPGALFALKTMGPKQVDEMKSGDKRELHWERQGLTSLPWYQFLAGLVDTFSEPQHRHLLLELFPHGTLQEYIHRHAPFPASQALFYHMNIMLGLNFMHQKGYVHGDVSPSNILMGGDGYLSVADFGHARKLDDPDALESLPGTPEYTAPEVIRGRTRPRYLVDWWAGGCILYEMLTGIRPFQGVDKEDTYRRIVAGRYIWPPRIRIAAGIQDLVDRILEVFPGRRLGRWGLPHLEHHEAYKKVSLAKLERRIYLAPLIPEERNLARTWLDPPAVPKLSIPDFLLI